MIKIIIFSGKAEAGKTTAAKYLKQLLHDRYRVAIVPYADYVKSTAKLLFDWDGEKDEFGRHLLQWWGTDVVRAKFPDFWVETVQRLAEVAQDEFDYLLIDDARFPNEIKSWADEYTMTVRIERPGYQNHLSEEQRNHISETALDNYNFDIVISAETKKELEVEIINKILPLIFERG